MTSDRPTDAAMAIPNLGASKAEIQAHYDREPRLYEQFLGPNSCVFGWHLERTCQPRHA